MLAYRQFPPSICGSPSSPVVCPSAIKNKKKKTKPNAKKKIKNRNFRCCCPMLSFTLVNCSSDYPEIYFKLLLYKIVFNLLISDITRFKFKTKFSRILNLVISKIIILMNCKN